MSPPALVCNGDPPLSAAYHLKVPDDALPADRETVPVPQREPGVVVGAVGSALMVATTEVLGVLSQPVPGS